jgi:rhodanese-related sulfurtransferase
MPAALPRWVEDLPRDRAIVVYCICGFQVNGGAVTELRQRGYDASGPRRRDHRLACDPRCDRAAQYLYL